jgi:hypothetical protein
MMERREKECSIRRKRLTVATHLSPMAQTLNGRRDDCEDIFQSSLQKFEIAERECRGNECSFGEKPFLIKLAAPVLDFLAGAQIKFLENFRRQLHGRAKRQCEGKEEILGDCCLEEQIANAKEGKIGNI